MLLKSDNPISLKNKLSWLDAYMGSTDSID